MSIFDIFSTEPAEDAAASRIAGLNAAYDKAISALNSGLTNATGYYDQAIGQYSNLSDTFNKGVSAYADATGVNGAEGNARAQSAFTSAPGYQYQVDQAITNADRGAASRGTLNSGGQRANEIGIASNLANQNWSNYLNSLSGYNTSATNVANSTSGLYSNLGNLNYQTGQDTAKYGWQKETGTGDANAAADLSAYNASGNFWNTLFNGAELATSAVAGGMK